MDDGWMVHSDLRITQCAAVDGCKPRLYHTNGAQLLRPSRSVTASFLVCVAWIRVFLCAPNLLSAAELKSETIKAFDQYVQKAELRMNDEQRSGSSFLWVDSLPSADRAAAYARLRSGEILVHPFATGLDIPDGMIHDWVGVVFIPNVTLDEALAEIQNYNDYARIYSPEIIRSKILQRDDDHFKVSLWLEQKSFATVVLHVVENVQYFRLNLSQLYSRSHSIQIAEVENPGTLQQHEDPPGTGHGYLWRLNDYRRFLQTPAGVYLQFEVIALSRDIPWGLEWLIKPFVTNVPRESLRFTLTRARASIETAAKLPAGAENGH
jgi:hypothetical protein